MKCDAQGEKEERTKQWHTVSCELYLRIAATAGHSIPLGHFYTTRVLDQVIVCSASVGISIACYRPIHVVKYGVLVTVQVVLFKPLSRATKEGSEDVISKG